MKSFVRAVYLPVGSRGHTSNGQDEILLDTGLESDNSLIRSVAWRTTDIHNSSTHSVSIKISQ